MSYEKEMDIDNKLNHYVKIAGIINNMFRPHKTSKKTRIKLYYTLAFPAVLNGSENLTITARDKKNDSSRDEYMRKTAGHTWTDYKTNNENAKEPQLWTKYRNTERNWLQRVNRMPLNQWRTQEFCWGGGSTNSVADRGQRERGSGGGSPLVRGSGGSCNLVQEISFHIVNFS